MLKGIYLLNPAEGLEGKGAPRAQILASGVSVPWALEAQALLREDWNVAADVWSVTSWGELRRDGLRCDEQAFLHPADEAPVPFVSQRLGGAPGPVVAVTDYMRAVPEQIARGSGRTSRRSARTASACPTPGPRPGAGSRSTAPRSWSGCCSSSPPAARSTPRRR